MNETYILEKINTLKFKNDCIVLENVYPYLLEQIFDFNKGITIIGGRDLDYEGETDDFYFCGSAYYGKCEVVKKYGDLKPIENKDDVYTRTSFNLAGRIIKNVPIAIECDENEDLDLYYICFNNGGVCTLYPFYSSNELDVRHRALSIWGKYDDIKTKENIERLKMIYQDRFDKLYVICKKYYKLCN